MFVGSLRCRSLVWKERGQSRPSAISVVLITYNKLSSEKVRSTSQTYVLLMTRSLVTGLLQHEFAAGSEAFRNGRLLHIVDVT